MDALMLASAGGHCHIVERLIIKNPYTVNRRAALMFAFNNGHKRIVELLKK